MIELRPWHSDLMSLTVKHEREAEKTQCDGME